MGCHKTGLSNMISCFWSFRPNAEHCQQALPTKKGIV
jgi:hypothetical protein